MTLGSISTGYPYQASGSYDTIYPLSVGNGTQDNKNGLSVSKAGEPDSNDGLSVSKTGRKSSPEECETCSERKYQDGSNENVSYKAASHISPEAAGSAVRAHEGEHVSNAYSKASEQNGKVISASVSIHTAVCPECGRTYVSGGTTNTKIKYSDESNPYQQNQKSLDALRVTGNHIDYAA